MPIILLMILFIDDERDYPGCNPHVVARTSATALTMLEERSDITEIWFDHDLGGEDTSIPVLDVLAEAAFMTEHEDITNPYHGIRVVVHTANPVGRDTIVRTLERWGYDYRISAATSWI